MSLNLTKFPVGCFYFTNKPTDQIVFAVVGGGNRGDNCVRPLVHWAIYILAHLDLSVVQYLQLQTACLPLLEKK